MDSWILKIIYLIGYNHYLPYFDAYIVPDLASEREHIFIDINF